MIITDIPYIKLWRGDIQGHAFNCLLTHISTLSTFAMSLQDATETSQIMSFVLPGGVWESMTDGEYSYTLTSQDGVIVAMGILIKRENSVSDVEHVTSREYVEYEREEV